MECLSGYLLLGGRLLEGRTEFADAWNFGPDTDDNRTVHDVLTLFKAHWADLEQGKVESRTQIAPYIEAAGRAASPCRGRCTPAGRRRGATTPKL